MTEHTQGCAYWDLRRPDACDCGLVSTGVLTTALRLAVATMNAKDGPTAEERERATKQAMEALRRATT
jgi:hypothetical protein